MPVLPHPKQHYIKRTVYFATGPALVAAGILRWPLALVTIVPELVCGCYRDCQEQPDHRQGLWSPYPVNICVMRAVC